MKLKVKKETVYLDGTDWLYEVGAAADGNSIYPDVESLKKYNGHWEGCGIVECEIVFKKWVIESDWGKVKSVSYTAKEIKNNAEMQKLDCAEKHLEYLEARVAKQKHKVVELKANLKKEKK